MISPQATACLAPPHSGSDASSAYKHLAVAPGQAIVGPGAIGQLGEVAARLGRRALVVAGPLAWRRESEAIAAPLRAAGVAVEVFLYDPDCTKGCAEAAVLRVRDTGCTLVVGVGGGKALDLAKLVADDAGLPVVTVPTSAATCAAWTALGNFYDDAHGFQEGRPLPQAPAAIIVDSALIARAPARLLASGLADTAAKWIETSVSVTYAEADAGTRAAWTMARFMYDEIRAWGVEAYQDARAGRFTPAVARAIEVNVCLAGTVGGLGGERCRSVAGHAVANALTTMATLPVDRVSYHGEKVAFGLITQLVLEDRGPDAADLAGFFAALGVPGTLDALGHPLDAAGLARVAAHVCGPHSTAHHLPFPVTPDRVVAAVVEADRLGAAVALA